MNVGDKVQARKAIDQDSNEVNILEAGKKYIVFFYPKDMTPGCTAEACSLRDGYAELKKLGYTLLGASTDSAASHQKFIAKHELPYTLISDENKELVNYFGVWGPKKFMGREYEGIHRKTFIIDENQTITHIIDKVKTKDSANQILELI